MPQMPHPLSALLLAAPALLFVIGCRDGGPLDATGVEAQRSGGEDKPRVALIMKSLANEFFSTMATGAEKHQADHAGDYTLVVNGIKDETDVARQVALVEEMVASGVDAIVIAPADSKTLVPALRRAKEAGVTVVNIDNRLDVGVLQQQKVTIPFVGPDNKEGARKVGEYVAGKLQKGDAVAIIEGLRTSFNGVQRREGFEQAMADAGMTVVASQAADWETARANTVASAMLSEHPEIKAILAANDSMALGAVAAVRAAGRDDVLVAGFDNIAAARDVIRDAHMIATADQHGDKLAVYGIETALQLLENPKAEVADEETPVDLVTAESLNAETAK